MMERVSDIIQYKQLLKETKKQYGRLQTNCFLFAPDIQKYIDQQRLFFETGDQGIFFFVDEKKFYQTYYHVSTEMERLDIAATDKPMLIRTIYMKDAKTEAQKKIDRLITAAGFHLLDTTTHEYVVAEDNLAEMGAMYERMEQRLERYGLELLVAKERHLDQMLTLRDNEPELKVFHIPYQTREEELEAIHEGRYACIVNQEGEVCAARKVEEVSGNLYGAWFCVKESYKNKYGLGVVMTGFEMKYAKDHHLPRVYGWIANDNVGSWTYHKRLGVQLTGKVADEWVR